MRARALILVVALAAWPASAQDAQQGLPIQVHPPPPPWQPANGWCFTGWQPPGTDDWRPTWIWAYVPSTEEGCPAVPRLVDPQTLPPCSFVDFSLEKCRRVE